MKVIRSVCKLLHMSNRLELFKGIYDAKEKFANAAYHFHLFEIPVFRDNLPKSGIFD